MKIFRKILTTILFASAILFTACSSNEYYDNYAGKPYIDSKQPKSPQIIPGKVENELYDLGGEGVAYHDTDSSNSGSGALNPADGSYLHEFRINESVDISYTKSNGVDDNPFNFVEPEMGKLYLGWTEPGEWVNYSVDVMESGSYKVGLMFTSNKSGNISLSVDDKVIAPSIFVPSTFVAEDSIQWRNWHHWNYVDSLTTVQLSKGKQVLKLTTTVNGNMNYDYLNFELIK